MKVKKFLALCMSVAVTATAITTVMPAAAETSSQTNPTTLFEESFDTYPYVNGYTDEGSTLPINYGDGKKATAYNSNQFRYWADARIDNNMVENSNYKKMMTAGTLKNHIQFNQYSGFGYNKVMTVTSQGGANYSGILKQSNITQSKITDKKLVFKVDFKIDRMYYGEGYGIYMSKANSNDELEPNQIENYYPAQVAGNDATEDMKKKQLLAIFPSGKVTLDSDGHNTDAIPAYAFGNKIGDVSANKNYTYTLELTPDETGSYKASAYLSADGSAGSKADITSNVPTVTDFATYTHIMMSPMVHNWTLYDGQFGKPSKITNPPQYENDKKIISLDNLKMTAEVIDNSVLFSDDFESYPYVSGYTDEGTTLPIYYGDGKKATAYNSNQFRYWADARIDNNMVENSNYKKMMTAGTLKKHIQFNQYSGFGNNKVMTITSQGGVNFSGILKQSNITSEKINNKKLVFSIDFKIDRMYYGEGYGIYMSNADSKGELDPNQIENWWPAKVVGNDATEAEKKKQLLAIFPSSKVTLDDDGHNQAAIPAYAFGNKIGDVSANKNYTYTLELAPDGTGSYKASAYLSEGGSAGAKVDITSNVPTAEEFATYTHIMMSPMVHYWTLYDGQFGQNVTTDSYKNDVKIISLDNLSMITTEPVNMDGVKVNGYAKVSGSAGSKTVTVKVMPKSGESIKPYIIAAVYNADGSLKDVKFATTEEEITTAQELEVSGVNANSESIKVFMWDGFTNTKPLTTSVEL